MLHSSTVGYATLYCAQVMRGPVGSPRYNAPDAFGALIALNRFGLGARPGDLAAAAGDPRGFLKGEVGSADVAVVTADLPPTSTALQQLFADQERIRQERERATRRF